MSHFTAAAAKAAAVRVPGIWIHVLIADSRSQRTCKRDSPCLLYRSHYSNSCSARVHRTSTAGRIATARPNTRYRASTTHVGAAVLVPGTQQVRSRRIFAITCNRQRVPGIWYDEVVYLLYVLAESGRAFDATTSEHHHHHHHHRSSVVLDLWTFPACSVKVACFCSARWIGHPTRKMQMKLLSIYTYWYPRSRWRRAAGRQHLINTLVLQELES